MTRNMICIGCPMGCELTVEVEDGKAVSVTGNTCGIGKKYAETEVSAPVRTITTTVLSEEGIPVPVKTKEPVPKDRITETVKCIKEASVKLPVDIGDVIIEDTAGTGVQTVATKKVTGPVKMAEITEFTFPSSTGKNTIHAYKCLPEGKPRGVVQIAHGITEYMGRYKGFMSFLADKGFVAVGNDHLGHGRSAETPEELGIFDEKDGWSRVLDDMDKLHDMMKEEYPDIPYIFFGHSMGSFLTRHYIILHPDKPDLAIICGTGHQARPIVMSGLGIAEAAVKMNGPRRKGEKLNDLAFGAYNKGIDNIRTDHDWLTRDTDSVDEYMADPLCGFIPCVSLFRDMLTGVSFITDPANIARMNKELPILFISGWKDPVGEYGAGVKRAFRAFCEAGMKHVHIKLYPNDRHELLNEIDKDDVMNDICGWIDKKLSDKAAGNENSGTDENGSI